MKSYVPTPRYLDSLWRCFDIAKRQGNSSVRRLWFGFIVRALGLNIPEPQRGGHEKAAD